MPTGRFPPPSVIGYALDGRFDLVSVDDQRAVVGRLRAIGVDVATLIRELAEQEDVGELLAELRAAQKEAHWRAIQPHHARFWDLYDRLTTTLQQQHLPRPEGARTAFVEFAEALSRPARELDLHDGDDSPALPRRRAQARQQRPGSRTTRIKVMHAPPDRSISAIRQRFMPFVRQLVATRIIAALKAQEDARQQRTIARRRDTRQQISRRINRPGYELTAAFIRAFYPWFGAGTTAEHVRKSLP